MGHEGLQVREADELNTSASQPQALASQLFTAVSPKQRPWTSHLADALWAIAVLTLAVGKDRESSVVARGALGIAACAAVALWPAFSTVMGLIATPDGPEGAGAWRSWSYASAFVPVVLGLIAAAMVARTRTVPIFRSEPRE